MATFQFPFRQDGHCRFPYNVYGVLTYIMFQFPFRRDGHCNVWSYSFSPANTLFQFPFRRDGHCNATDWQFMRNVDKFQFSFRRDGHCNLIINSQIINLPIIFQFPFRRDGHCNTTKSPSLNKPSANFNSLFVGMVTAI